RRQSGDGALRGGAGAEVAGAAVPQVDDVRHGGRRRVGARLGGGAGRGQRVEDRGVGRLDLVAGERGAADDGHGAHDRRLVGQLVVGRRRLGGGDEQRQVRGPRRVVGDRLVARQHPLEDLLV